MALHSITASQCAFTQPPPADGPAFPPATSRPAVGSGQRPPLIQASCPTSYHSLFVVHYLTDAAGWSIQQRPCSLASITTAAGRSTHCPGTLASITDAAGWSTQRCPWTLALIINIAAVS
ncbi:hypothetical protein ACOMHN_051417 [Nucella lapillus]